MPDEDDGHERPFQLNIYSEDMKVMRVLGAVGCRDESGDVTPSPASWAATGDHLRENVLARL